MKKVGVLIIFTCLLLTTISAVSVDSEFQKITHYAEEYEIGNLNYVQLLVKISSVRQNLNEKLGSIDFEGGILKKEQMRDFLGVPQEETRWVWVEGAGHEKKLEEYVPVWNKIIFDGKKIQIRLDAYPSILRYSLQERNIDLGFNENEIVYRLHFQTEFKKPKEDIDIKSKINEIAELAKTFNSNPSSSNAEVLAEKSVNAERTFESFFKQNQGKCEDLMKSIFGAENLREIASTEVREINFYDAEDFEVIIRLEMCGDCEWSRINLDFRLDGRGKFRMPKDVQDFNPNDKNSREKFMQMSDEEFKSQIKSLLNEIKSFLDQRDFSSAMSSANKLRMLNEAWNEKSNNVWEQINKEFESKLQSMSEQEMKQMHENYGWLKQEQQQRQKVKDLQQHNFDTRKMFYMDLFSDYNMREFYFQESQYEKRLVEEFRKKDSEVCNNNKDDNDDEKTDCEDSQCGGKFCGTIKGEFIVDNQTIEQDVDLYCIAGVCQQKEEIVEEKNESVCGNHVCEDGEESICTEDCSICPDYLAINCSGKVIFSGTDETGCPLEPICIEDTENCELDEDCVDPLCGNAVCVDGMCEVSELEECQKAECQEGQEKRKNCDSGEEIVSEVCLEGAWISTEIMCEGTEEIIEEEVAGTECVVVEDCGGENDVCSNGNCVTIPQSTGEESEEQEEEIEEEVEETQEEIVEIEQQETDETETQELEQEQQEIEEELEESESQEFIEEPQVEEQEVVEEPQQEPEQEEPAPESEPSPEPEQESNSEITGESILKLPAYFFLKLAGAITGGAVEGEETTGETETTSDPEPSPEPEPAPESEPEPETFSSDGSETDQEDIDSSEEIETDSEGVEEPSDNYKENSHEDDEERDREKREEREKEKHEEEQKERCNEECERTCYDINVRPCAEKCIRESCGEELDCDVEAESKNCESKCKTDDSCEKECVPKCMKGGDWWKEYEMNPEDFEDEHKQEKGVFTAGGGCRTSQGRTEGFIWFGGWGEPFQDIEPLKHKYYQGGEADWCKYDFENLKKQRKEFEKGLNQKFATWFFEKYLPNSAENWEGAMSGIYELYWNDVDNSRQMAERMQCLGIDQLPNHELINVEYETEYGKLEFWEEIKTIKLPGDKKEVEVISPYMKVWVFPSKEFILYEMKKSMKNHEFPGSPEEKLKRKQSQGGPTEEEREMIKQDESFMEDLKDILNEYNGNINAVVQFKDKNTNEIVFNLFVTINEDEIIQMKPMLPEEVPEYDVKVELDFEPIYEMIMVEERDLSSTRIESPPWDKKAQPIQKIKEVTNGVKMYFKMRSLMNSAVVTPESAEGDAKDLFKLFFEIMDKHKDDREMEFQEDEFNGEFKDIENEVFGESKEELTGEVIGKLTN